MIGNALPVELLVVFTDVCCKPNAAPLGLRRVHELTDGREHGGDRLVMRGELFLDACLELIEAASEILVRSEEFAELHERAHNVDAHLDGAWTAEDVGGLDGAVLGEGVGSIATPTATGTF